MTKIDERTAANMDVVLEQVCRGLPHGGDHESREHIAQRLMQSAKKEMSLWVARCGQSRPYRAIQQQIGMKLTHRFAELTPENRPQDPNMDGTGPRIETMEHGGEYQDSMPNGVAQSEADHFEKCPVCSQWFDMRDLAQVAEHIHDGSKIEVLEGPAPPRDPPVN